MENPLDNPESKAVELTDAYNGLMKAFNFADNSEFASRKMWLTFIVNAYSSELEKAGFLISEDGTLTRKTMEHEELEEENWAALFQGEDSFAERLLDRTLKVGFEALASLSKSPKLYRANGSFNYAIRTGTLFNEVY